MGAGSNATASATPIDRAISTAILDGNAGERASRAELGRPSSNGGSAITAYKVFQGSTPGGETLLVVIGNMTTYSSMGLISGQVYYFKISAVNAWGASANTTEVHATTWTVPGAPVLTTTAGNLQVVLSWTVPNNGGSAITGYRVYRGLISGGEILLIALSNMTAYNVSGLTNGQTYYFKVQAINVMGNGANSTEAFATPATVPASPVTLSATPGNTQIVLTWTAPATNGGSPITGYRIYRGMTSGSETLFTTVSVVLTYTMLNVTNGQTYYFTVSAVNAMGTGATSTEASTTPFAPVAPVFTLIPSNKQIANDTSTTLTWQVYDPTTSSPTYTIYCNGTVKTSGSWASGVNIVYTTANLPIGTYSYSIFVNNGLGKNASSSVTVMAVAGAVRVSATIIGGRTIYVRGETFIVTTVVNNSLDSNGIAGGIISLDFGGATGFTANCTYSGISILAGGAITSSFRVTINTIASASCNLRVHFTASSPSLNLWSVVTVVTTQSPASLAITSITYRTGAGTYVGGITFIVRVAYLNTGGTVANAVQTALTFGGYSKLSSNMTGSITVPASGTAYNDFLITVAASATTASVTIGATWIGVEAYTSRALNGSSGSTNLAVAIQSQANVVINSLSFSSGNGTYVGGQAFNVTVTYGNLGSTKAQNVIGTLVFGGYTGVQSVSTSPASVTINGGGAAIQTFVIRLSPTATSMNPLTISCTWSGIEQLSARFISSAAPATLNATIRSQASVAISSFVCASGNGTFIGGSTFQVQVTYKNTGGAQALNVNGLLSFGGYAGVQGVVVIPSRVTVNGGGATSTQTFTITLFTTAPLANPLTISCSWTGIEVISSRALSSVTPSALVVYIIANVPPTFSVMPSNKQILNSTSTLLTWRVLDLTTSSRWYTIYANGTLKATGNWTTGADISYNTGRLFVGNYNFTIVVFDGLGMSASNSVVISVRTKPVVTSPANIIFQEGTPGQFINWIVSDQSYSSGSVIISRNSLVISNGSWLQGVPVTVSLSGLAPGIYSFVINASNPLGAWSTGTVMVTVQDKNPTIYSPANIIYEIGTTGHVIRWNASDYYVYNPLYVVYLNSVPIAKRSWTINGTINQIVDGWRRACGIMNSPCTTDTTAQHSVPCRSRCTILRPC